MHASHVTRLYEYMDPTTNGCTCVHTSSSLSVRAHSFTSPDNTTSRCSVACNACVMKYIISLSLSLSPYIHICMYVCMYVYIYIYTYMYTHTYTHAFYYVCTYVCVYIYIYIYQHLYLYLIISYCSILNMHTASSTPSSQEISTGPIAMKGSSNFTQCLALSRHIYIYIYNIIIVYIYIYIYMCQNVAWGACGMSWYFTWTGEAPVVKGDLIRVHPLLHVSFAIGP